MHLQISAVAVKAFAVRSGAEGRFPTRPPTPIRRHCRKELPMRSAEITLQDQ